MIFFHTILLTASFLLYHLSRNMDAQDKLRVECESINGEDSTNLMKKMRGDSMDFLLACIPHHRAVTEAKLRL